MLIRIVAKPNEAPTSDLDGQPVWTGGHPAPGTEGTTLPASILVSQIPELEIGTWYSLDQLRQLISKLEVSNKAAWTTVGIAQDGPDRAFETKIEVNEQLAAKLICESALEYCSRLNSPSSTWIRID